MDLDRPPPNLLEGASLFLDLDGTLVDLADTPDEVALDEEMQSLLSRLQAKLSGRIAVVSGRSAADLLDRLRPVTMVVAGSHGLEWIGASGELNRSGEAGGLAEVIEELRPLEASHPGVLVEAKPLGVALHYRLAPSAESICRRFAEQAAAAAGLEIQLGKMVVELKPAGGNKGVAIRRFMSQPGFAGTRPVFVGDDLTDEHGFAIARELGGAGILVGDPRETAATYALPDVSAVRSWLRQACEILP